MNTRNFMNQMLNVFKLFKTQMRTEQE